MTEEALLRLQREPIVPDWPETTGFSTRLHFRPSLIMGVYVDEVLQIVTALQPIC